jgi:hypothetical protein
MKLKSAGDMMKLAKEIERHVNNMLIAQVIYEHKREQVDKIQRRLLAENVYEYDPKWAAQGCKDCEGRVTDPGLSYLMRDEHAKDYHDKLNAIHLASGFDRAKDGYCPALCAESVLREAQNLVLDIASEHIGTNFRDTYGETRKEALELFTKIVINRPGYVPPKFPKAA